MKNFICDGDRMQVVLTAPVQAGDVIVVGGIAAVSQDTGIADDTVVVYTEGVFELPKGTGAISQGVKAYWDATAKQVTATATSNTLIGFVYLPAAVSDTTVQVKLNY